MIYCIIYIYIYWYLCCKYIFCYYTYSSDLYCNFWLLSGLRICVQVGRFRDLRVWLVEWMVQFLLRWVGSQLLLEGVIFIQASDNTLVALVALCVSQHSKTVLKSYQNADFSGSREGLGLTWCGKRS